MKKIANLIAMVMFLTASFAELSGQTIFQPYNLGFENSVTEYEPQGWQFSNKAIKYGYSFSTTVLESRTGKKSFVIESPQDTSESFAAIAYQSIYAKSYIGKTINFSAYLKAFVEMPDNYSFLWIKVYDAAGNIISTESTENKPTFFPTWEKTEIKMRIDSNVARIDFGVALKGVGKVYVDDVSFALIGADPKFNNAPKEISKSSMPYLQSFAEIFGLVRFFYPTDYYETTDWGKLAHSGIIAAEKSKNDQEFVDNMYLLFKPIAPLIDISKGKPNFDFQKPTTKPIKAITWMHKGIASDMTTMISSSKRINIFESQRSEAGLAIQANPTKVDNYVGLKFEMTIKAAVELENNWSFANLMIRFENSKQQVIASLSVGEPFIVSKEMKSYKIEGTVPDDAKSFRAAMNLYGEGKAYFDDIEMTIIESGGSRITLPIANSEFESARSSMIPGWLMPDVSSASGYSLEAVTEKDKVNKRLLIYSGEKSKISLPKPENIYTVTLPIGLKFSLATVLYSKDYGVVPESTGKLDYSLSQKPDDFLLNADDRESRLAIIIDAWNYVKHFNSFGVDNKKLDQLLPSLLNKVAVSGDESVLISSLNEIFALLNDNQTRVWKTNTPDVAVLPIIWKWIDGKLVIVKAVAETNLKNGDVITEINSKPTEKVLTDLETRISGNNPIWKRLRSLAELRSGEWNTPVKLEISRKGEKSFEIELKRNINPDELIEERPERISMLSDDIVYCDMTRTNDTEFSDYIKDIEKYKGIVFDARGTSNISEHLLGLFTDNPVNSSKMLIDCFVLPEKQMMSTNDVSSKIKKIKKLQHMKIIFICDERSIGLSESFLSIVKDNEIAQIVGRTTAGSGGEIAAVPLFGGYNFSQTVVKAYSPNGDFLFGKGLVPDVEIKQTIGDAEGEKDPMIQKSLEIIQGMK